MYDGKSLQLSLDSIAGGLIRLFVYELPSGDGLTEAMDAGYFSDAGKRGLQAGDVIWVTDGAGLAAELQAVSLTAAGAATVRLAKNRITFRMFGAIGDGVTDDSVAINLAASFMRDNVFDGRVHYNIDGEDLFYYHSISLNFTKIRRRNWSLLNANFLSACAGKIAVDFGGSRFGKWDNITVHGDATDSPAAGIFIYREDDGGSLPFDPSANQDVGNVTTLGTFTKFAMGLLATETTSLRSLRINNDYHSNTSTCLIVTGNSDVIANFCGLPTSDYCAIGTGSQSMGAVNILHNNCQRNPAYMYNILAVTKANPAVVTIAVADMAEAIASYGFANGATVFFDEVLGSNVAWTTTVNGRVYTIANLNAGTGTFELLGIDTSAVTGTFSSGVVKNDTGPSMVLGQLWTFKEHNSYHANYGRSTYRYDLTTDTDWNWSVTLSGGHEPAKPHLIDFIGNADVFRFARNFRIESANSNSYDAPIGITGFTGTATCCFTNLELMLGHEAQPSSRTIQNPQFVHLRGANLVVCDAQMVQLDSAFGEASGVRWVTPNGNPRIVMSANPFTIITKRASQAVAASTVMVNDDQLKYNCRASGTYNFEFNVFFDSPPGADFKFGINGPTSPTRFRATVGYIDPNSAGVASPGSAAVRSDFNLTAYETTGLPVLYSSVTNGGWLTIKGILANGLNAGDLVFMWAQNNASGSSTVLHGSSLRVSEYT